MYDILEAKIEFKDGKIKAIAVLVEMSENSTRAFLGTTMPRGGYMHIPPSAKLSEELLQEVAGYGMKVEASKFFPKSK